MKTTLELDDDLLIEAKAVAARRRTTLRAIVEHALRRELQPVLADRGRSLATLPTLRKSGRSNPNAALHRALSTRDVEDVIALLDGGGRRSRS
jgi:Arc/MetJ family transcription regulator